MMQSFFAWVFFELPWYVQLALLVVAIGIPIYILACAIFGTAVANRYILHGVIIIVTLGLASKLRQDGWNARKAEEKRAEERAEKVVDDVRDRTEKLPDDQLNQKVDKWTRD